MWLINVSLIIILLFPNLSISSMSDRQYASMPHLFHLDNYDNCILYGKESLYCTITFQLFPKNLENPSETWKVIEKISSRPENYRHDILRHGVCVLETCPNLTVPEISENNFKFRQNLEQCYNQKYEKYGIRGEIKEMHCENNESTYPINYFDVLFGLFFLMFILLVLFAWVYDIYHNKETRNKSNETFFDKFISSFSLSENWNRLTTVDLSNPDVRALRCMQGVRFFNMIIVIFSHTITVNLSVPLSNPKYAEEMPGKVSVRFLGDGSRYTIIQTFFMMSTWLLTYQFFLEMEKKKRVPISYLFRSFIKRYIRLTPALAIMVGFYATWMVHISRGPLWHQIIGKEYQLCRTNWWSNLIYLNNYIHGKNMCSAHLWYTALDIQFYIMGLLLLWLIWYNPNKIIFILGSLCLFHTVATFCIIYWNEWDSAVRLYPEILYDMNIVDLDEIHVVYKGIIPNIPGFVAGLGYGYAFYKYRNQKLFTKRIHVVLWRIVSWSAALGIVLFSGVLSNIESYFQNRPLSNAIYGSLNRSVFIFGIGLWMFGLTQGQGHLTRIVCEWPPTYVLGRLTYGVFLTHSLFQRLKTAFKRYPNYIDNYFLTLEIVGDIAWAYLGAAFLTLFFEMPITQLQKWITSPPKQERTKEIISPEILKNQ